LTKQQLFLEQEKLEQERNQYKDEKKRSMKVTKEILIQTDQDLDTVSVLIYSYNFKESVRDHEHKQVLSNGDAKKY
jgi:hypothetical protein